MPHPIVEDELLQLERVSALLEKSPAPPAASQDTLIAELRRLRDLLVRGEEAKDAAALHQQYEHQSALLRQLRAAAGATQVDPASPYFAHLRLVEEGRPRDLLLGKATRIDGEVRIVDWRNAPISRVYYRYAQGDEYEEEFAGRARAGRVAARRTVTIREGVLERVEAPEGIFERDAAKGSGWRHRNRQGVRLTGGEGAALRAHAGRDATQRRLGTDLLGSRRRADKRLPELAGLLDPAQFDLITRPGSGFVVIRGSAGSGKTTVALHRIAYLAYEDPEIDSERTLFVVFSPALRSYVGSVLPALGVERAQVRSFHEWAADHRRRLFPRLPRAKRADTPAVVQRLKLHPALLLALEEQVRRVPGAADAGQAFDDWASVLTQPALLARAMARSAPGAFGEAELREAAQWNRARHEDLDAWLAGDPDAPGELDAEDDALLLRAWQLRVGPLPAPGRGGRPLRYRHVAIDEVQDFSPTEVRVLLDCVEPRGSITLAGDTQQHVMQEAGFSSWSEFFTHLGLAGTEVSTLRVSYRSSRPIMMFAHGVLGPLAEDPEPPATVRDGPPVELFAFTDAGACVAFLADALRELAREEPLASVAVLTPAPSVSALYHRGLDAAEVPRLRRVERQDFTFAPGVEVTEIAQAKGLEFDYVVLVEVDAERFPDAATARRLLHVGATRAVHQLWVTRVGEPSPLVAAAEAVGTSPR
jgi:DNA helicase-2/ATP-dependent DNA helicase PcrA